MVRVFSAEVGEELKEFPGYFITPNGTVTSFHHSRRGRVLKRHLKEHGYYIVVLRKDGRTFYPLLHRLLATQYLPNPLNKTEVNHRDGDRKNFSLENLEWVFPQENMQHAFLTNPAFRKNISLSKSGEANPSAKLSQREVREIREKRLAGAKLKDIALQYKVSAGHVSSLCREKRWERFFVAGEDQKNPGNEKV